MVDRGSNPKGATSENDADQRVSGSTERVEQYDDITTGFARSLSKPDQPGQRSVLRDGSWRRLASGAADCIDETRKTLRQPHNA